MDTQVQITVPEELQKISQAVVDGIKSYKAGGSWQTIGMSALPVVLSEFGNMDELKAEFSSASLAPWAGAALGAVAGVFLAKTATAFMAKRKAMKDVKPAPAHPHVEAHAAPVTPKVMPQ